MIKERFKMSEDFSNIQSKNEAYVGKVPKPPEMLDEEDDGDAQMSLYREKMMKRFLQERSPHYPHVDFQPRSKPRVDQLGDYLWLYFDNTEFFEPEFLKLRRLNGEQVNFWTRITDCRNICLIVILVSLGLVISIPNIALLGQISQQSTLLK